MLMLKIGHGKARVTALSHKVALPTILQLVLVTMSGSPVEDVSQQEALNSQGEVVTYADRTLLQDPIFLLLQLHHIRQVKRWLPSHSPINRRPPSCPMSILPRSVIGSKQVTLLRRLVNGGQVTVADAVFQVVNQVSQCKHLRQFEGTVVSKTASTLQP
eukprot:2145458-Amphidinium_carterae.2